MHAVSHQRFLFKRSRFRFCGVDTLNMKQDSQMRVPATATHGDISTMSPTRMNNGKKRNSTDAMLVHVSF
ncbi:hypothetical protein WK38_23535 [Burkholderia ubonensis]|nr:hypothetical protein WK38_23535 [Burkholderia ubonensis]